ncbi:hypothetical protein HYZ82_02800 [Candidatus Nomurabacteria bacterium]|nr:hypothetical protein [Candidatus Nomurabacteria bacterium]
MDYSGDKRDKREVGYHDTHIEEKPPKVRPEDRPYADPIPDTFDPKLQSRLDSFEEALANPVRDGVFLPPT